MRGVQQPRDWTRFLMRLIATGIGLGWWFLNLSLVGDGIFIERYGRSATTVSMAIPLGILIAWRWEGIGGAVVIIHPIAEAVVVYYSHVWAGEPYSEGLLTALFATLPFLTAGILFPASWWRLRRAGIAQDE